MPIVQSSIELSFEQLAHAIDQLSQSERQILLQQVNQIRPLYEEHCASEKEAELLLKINQYIPNKLQQRFNVLFAKRDARTLTPTEYEELLRLTDEIECLDAQRMELIIALAELRGQPLVLLLEELGVSANNE